MNTPAAPQPSIPRLVSVDALRGFDMCWILGMGSALTGVLKAVAPAAGITALVTKQLEHAEWEGFHFYDLIFPLFLFIAGVSMSIALPRRVARDGTAAAVRHLVARALVIFALGVFFSGGLKDGWEKIRWLGVLQRIGLASAAAGILSLWTGTRGLVTTAAALLLGYCLLLGLVPVPGFGAGDFAEGRNLTNYLDSIWLPGRKYDGDHDPEGILSTLPAIATALLGVLAGKWISGDASAQRKAAWLVMAGAVLFLLGWCWQPFFPVIKKIWSSSFVLVAGGCSAMLLGVFVWIIEVMEWRAWATPFVWVGANPITLYMVNGLGVFRSIAERLTGHPGRPWAWLPAVMSFGVMLLAARWLHRRGIFIRV
ncbi:MAG: heparan-alpha-glucosaminide N-acetyltransferase domain-containing protein [Verrucomicrobiaceae bacterium]|nr:heparan-alpha-glucosaminide N-acetyltransferase domain-containing protein [Verrucomicrobiaceae bacterium]